MKQRGMKILAMLLTLAMVVGLMPGMSLTARADVPYASLKNTTAEITFDGKEWYLIDYDASTVTLLAKECVGLSVFGSNTTYSGSTVETYVNNWYSDNISTNAKTMVSGGMFLLTLEQVNTIASTSTDVLLCEVPNGADGGWWWLSTPGTGNNCVSCVYGANASVLDYGYEYSWLFGVRPALKLDLSKVSFDSTSNTFMLPTVAVTSVTLELATASMTVGGDAVALTATVSPDNATDKTVKWSVGGTDAGAVTLYSDAACTAPLALNTAIDTLTVYAKGTAAGSATVIVTSNADATKSASCAVTVSVATYSVTVADTPNGTVTASKTTAAAGETITLTITPASGYQVQAITVTDVNNNPVTVTNNSFTMPAANVTVTVTFIAESVLPTNYTVSFFANGGGGVMNPVTVPANTIYTLPACGFTPPARKQFKAWQLSSTEFAPGDTIKVDSNAEFVALWKDDDGSGESGHGGITGDIVFIGGGYGGADEWYVGGYAPQYAYRVSLAPMQGGSAALGLMTGDSGTALNVYPTTTVFVFPNANPGYVLDKIVWSLIDGSASYDITEAQNFVMPAMDVVVYVTFRPVG